MMRYPGSINDMFICLFINVFYEHSPLSLSLCLSLILWTNLLSRTVLLGICLILMMKECLISFLLNNGDNIEILQSHFFKYFYKIHPNHAEHWPRTKIMIFLQANISFNSISLSDILLLVQSKSLDKCGMRERACVCGCMRVCSKWVKIPLIRCGDKF